MIRTWLLLPLVPSLFLSSQAIGAINLPAPGGGNTFTFGDFQVYSMAALQSKLDGQPSSPNGSDAFAVGAAKADDVIIVTSNSGGPFTDNGAGIDDAFLAPSGSGGGGVNDTFFLNPSVWTAQTSALRGAIDVAAGEKFVAWFNFNETNSVPGLEGQDLLAWAKVILRDTAAVNPAPDLEFYVRAGNPGPPELPGFVNPGPTPFAPDPDINSGSFDPSDPEWAYVHGQVTFDEDGNFLHFGVKETGAPFFDPATADDISQDLGVNQASFAVYNATLSDEILNPSSIYDELRVESLFLSHIDDGKEQVFIRGARIGGGLFSIPEPFSLFVWSGLFACAFLRRSRCDAVPALS